MKLKVKEMFDYSVNKYGSVFWNGIELALTLDPYPDVDIFGQLCFRADAMDEDGNLWSIRWDTISDVDECLDYYSQVEDWDNPCYVEMVDKGYYLD